MFSALPLEKIRHLLRGGQALDLGSGDFGFITRFREFGYEIDAVDIREATPVPKGIRFFKQDMLTFEIRDYDLIIARNSLPFTDFRKMVRKISVGLNHKGITFFTLFGPRDAWSGKGRGIDFIDYDEAIDLVQASGLSIYRRSTEEGHGPTMEGKDKYWHIHTFLCVK